MEPGHEYICLKVGILARIIGAFVSPPAHIRSMFFPSYRGRHDIVTHDEAIARLQHLNKSSSSQALDDEHIHIVQCEVALQFLVDYGLCGILTEAEARMYGKSGYVFPSLRYPCEVLTIPFLGDPSPAPPHIVARGDTEWFCKACRNYIPDKPAGACPFCGISNCGSFVCAVCHGDVHAEIGEKNSLFLINCREVAQDGTVDCIRVRDAEAVKLPFALVSNGCAELRNGTEEKTLLGFRLRSTRNELCFGSFSGLVMKLRALIDPRFRVFSNFVSLRDALGNDILLVFQPTAWEGISGSTGIVASPEFKDDNMRDAFIYVVVYGVSPQMWRCTVPALLEICDVVEPLCPACLQIDTFNVLLPGKPSGATGSAAVLPKDDAAKTLICALGHRQQTESQAQQQSQQQQAQSQTSQQHQSQLQANQHHHQQQLPAALLKGVALDYTVYRNKLWAPIYRNNFYECSEGLWEQQGPALVTVLTDKEKTPARREEYLRARTAFYQFVGKNMEDVIRLTKVEFIHNDAIEAPFTQFFLGLTQRALTLEPPGNGAKDGAAKKPPSSGALAGLMDNTKKGYGDKDETEEWRSWILGQLQNSMYRISGNDGINLILGWHGTSEDNIRSIVQHNFYDMSDPGFAAARKTDPGFFGPGVYFSQYPTYGSVYAEKRKSNTLLLSWVLMGTTYPVTEEPMTLKNLVDGYDSHYAIVDAKFGRPIKPTDPPGYDEIVVFRKAQILPRYVIHFEKIDKPVPNPAALASTPSPYKLLSSSSSSQIDLLPPEIKDAYPVFIWIDPNFASVDLAMEAFRMHYKKLYVKKCASAIESKAFLSTYGKQISSKLYVITNRYRQQDGGDNAWENAVRIVKECGLNDVPIIIFCGAPEKIQKHVTSWKNVFTFANAKDILMDCKKRFKSKKQ